MSELKDQLRRAEWKAWQEVVKELRLLGIDINFQDKLNDDLIAWSKSYHLLEKAIEQETV